MPPHVTAAHRPGETLMAILGFHLVTRDLPRLVAFYHGVLGFSLEGPKQPIGEAEIAQLSTVGGGMRQRLSIGQQHVAIEQFEVAGQPYPAYGDAASPWFQHLALVVGDIAAVHAGLRDAAPISRHGPQQLPPSSGGVTAFKFRDPDGHPLELLEFPADDMPEIWRNQTPIAGQVALGIDHSAISVGDVGASTQFYTRLGLALGPTTLNSGPTQQDLDDLPNVRVAVAPMRPPAGTPHLELLGYEIPRGTVGPALRANDVAATRISWQGTRPSLLADPDGHLHQVVS